MSKTTKTFTIVGISTLNGVVKPRFANSMDRVKVLVKNGHEDVGLFELNEPMNKVDAVSELIKMDVLTDDDTAVLEAWLVKNVSGAKPAVAATEESETEEATDEEVSDADVDAELAEAFAAQADEEVSEDETEAA